MHLHPLFPGVIHRRLVGYDHRVHPFEFRTVDHLPHIGDIFVEEYRIEGQVGLDSVFPANGDDAGQVVERKIHARPGPHIEALHAEINGIGAALNGALQRFR